MRKNAHDTGRTAVKELNKLLVFAAQHRLNISAACNLAFFEDIAPPYKRTTKRTLFSQLGDVLKNGGTCRFLLWGKSEDLSISKHVARNIAKLTNEFDYRITVRISGVDQRQHAFPLFLFAHPPAGGFDVAKRAVWQPDSNKDMLDIMHGFPGHLRVDERGDLNLDKKMHPYIKMFDELFNIAGTNLQSSKRKTLQASQYINRRPNNRSRGESP